MSTEEVAARALEASGPNAPPMEVVELSDDESEGLMASIASATSTGPSNPSPSIPPIIIVPYTSDDFELAQKLFVEPNREAIDIPSDGALIDLISDEED